MNGRAYCVLKESFEENFSWSQIFGTYQFMATNVDIDIGLLFRLDGNNWRDIGNNE